MMCCDYSRHIHKHNHDWIPCARFPQLAVCFYCTARARWSVTLGCYVRLIPGSHTRDGQMKRYARYTA